MIEPQKCCKMDSKVTLHCIVLRLLQMFANTQGCLQSKKLSIGRAHQINGPNVMEYSQELSCLR